MSGVPGVGVLFNPALSEFVRTRADSLDYLSLIPDRAWEDRGPEAGFRFVELAPMARLLDEISGKLPIVLHSIGLSICSADVFDTEYLHNLGAWRRRLRSPWVSEHLSFSRVGSGHETNAAMALPAPLDREVLDLLIPRIRAAQDEVGCDFLLENNVYYFQYPDQEMTEAEFLTQMAAETGCGLLLDLHNVYTNSLNHGFDALEFLGSLALEQVKEVHVAGGSKMMGFHTDSHRGPVEDGVWELLRYVAPRAPELRGVTFEFHESSWPLLRTEGVAAEIEKARAVLSRSVAA